MGPRRLTRAEPHWLSEELAHLVFLQALVIGQSQNQVLENIRATSERWNADLDHAPSDVAGIGEVPSDDKGQ